MAGRRSRKLFENSGHAGFLVYQQQPFPDSGRIRSGNLHYTAVPLDYSDPAKLTYDGISEVPGLSATLSETTMNMGDIVTFQVKAATSTAPGTYQITLIANSGSTTRTSTFFLIVPITSIRLSTASLNFGSVQVGQKSAPQTVTMTNFGQSAVSITKSASEPALPSPIIVLIPRARRPMYDCCCLRA